MRITCNHCGASATDTARVRHKKECALFLDVDRREAHAMLDALLDGHVRRSTFSDAIQSILARRFVKEGE